MALSIQTIQKKSRALQKRFLRALKEYAHLTYALRVVFALTIGLFGVGTVYAFSGVENLAGLRSALTAMVAGSAPVVEEPIVLSGVSVVGEVVPARELALSARASGVITGAAEVGARVETGDLIVRVDAEAARRAVRSAETSLAAARLFLRANESAESAALSLDATARSGAQVELVGALAAGREEVAAVLPLLPDVITGLSGILYGGAGFSDDGVNYLMAHAGIIEADNEAVSPLIAQAGDDYLNARRAYESAYALFHNESSPTDTEQENLILSADEMLRALTQALNSTGVLFSFVKDHRASLRFQAPEVFASYEESLANYIAQVNDQSSIIQGTHSLIEAARAVIDGDAPSTSSPEGILLEIQQAELALEDARARLSYYELRAPFAGTIARVDKREAQYVDDGETVALLVARENIVRLYLMQGEAVRVKMGTRVLVSVEGAGVSVPGVVKEMDAVGRKNEDGIVMFEAVIGFPKPDERLKPGMQVQVGFEIENSE